jgi:hypothetical protein
VGGERVELPGFGTVGGWKLIDGRWLVVEFEDQVADEGENGYDVDATVIDLAGACR